MVTDTHTDLLALVAAINVQHGTRFTLGARYDSGEQGAYALTGDNDAHFVLKCGAGDTIVPRFRAAAMATARLRQDGYPAPRYRYVGEIADCAYAVLDALPGAPMEKPSALLIPQLFALNSTQVGRGGDGAKDWPQLLIQTLLDGAEGYCEIDTLRSYSSETAALLARCQVVAERACGVACITGDLVHYDFNPANILVSEGRITGVVDWDGTCIGDCAFDLATLHFHTYGIPALRKTFGLHLRQRLDPRIAALYIAHMIVRQLDWVIRHNDAMAVVQWLAIACAIGEDFFPPM